MKEVDLYTVLKEWFETHDTCTVSELYDWVHKYREKHNCYVPYHRDEYDYVIHTLGNDEFYEDKENDRPIIRKQEVFYCSCCGVKIKKYPDVDKYNKVVKNSSYLDRGKKIKKLIK